MTEYHDPISDPMHDPHSPEHYLDTPHEGYGRVYWGTAEFEWQDLSEQDIHEAFVDVNIVNFTLQPDPVTLDVSSAPLTLYYADGGTHQLYLHDIGDTAYTGPKFVYVEGRRITVALDDLTPLYNPYATPGLAFIKREIIEELQRRAQEQLDMAELVNTFATILAQYSQVGGVADTINSVIQLQHVSEH
jgi:hypothetical protein